MEWYVGYFEEFLRHIYSIYGNISVNTTTISFNQSIPLATITLLFTNPVNLSNLHQPWFMNKTNSLSNILVAAEIYLVSIQANSSYVNRE
jgi:hypothetical protein